MPAASPMPPKKKVCIILYRFINIWNNNILTINNVKATLKWIILEQLKLYK